MQKHLRAAEFRRLAMEATALAEGSTLTNVRQKHELAAERWASLATKDEEDRGRTPTAGAKLNDNSSQEDIS